ncbi:hypothetical protein ACFQ9X_00750 [Catenulispora yoronensis]
MTAAGTVPPAKVLVLGAGVAGLQAIATAKRLGAVVEAYDVRAAAAEEIRSLGAKFVSLDIESQTSTTGGYAREQAADAQARQRKALTPYVAAADAVITTAAVPGRPAPLLVTAEMVEKMRPGSVLVDLAADNPNGGNCELSRPGEDVRHGGVLIHGGRNVPSELAGHASRLYGANMSAFILAMCRDGVLLSTPEEIAADEIAAACCVLLKGSSDEFHRLADRVRAGRLLRLRSHLEGFLDPAHAFDVRRERHPRRHSGRRDHRHRFDR